MVDMKFSQLDDIDWSGAFGFAGKDDDLPMSGKISYSKSQGIQLSLLAENREMADGQGVIARRMMHAHVLGPHGLQRLTLFNVFLSFAETNLNAYRVYGGAEAIIFDWIHYDSVVKELGVRYSSSYESFLFPSTSLEDNYVKMDALEGFRVGGIDISFKSQRVGTFVGGVNSLDSMFWSRKPEVMEGFKRDIEDIWEKFKKDIYKTTDITLVTAFHSRVCKIEDFLRVERDWRVFIDVMIVDEVNILNSYITVEYEARGGEVRDKRCQVIFSYPSFDVRKKEKNRNNHFLPITFSTFDGDSDQERMSAIGRSFQRWRGICESSDWNLVYLGIRKCMSLEDSFEYPSFFVGLQSAISAFLSLACGSKHGYPEELINRFASDIWKESVRKNFYYAKSDNDLNKFLGKELKSVRNSIEHPTDDDRNGRSFHRAIRNNPFVMQEIMGFLSALFLKAILNYIGLNDQEALEKHCNYFIEDNAYIRPIDFT